MRIQSSYLSHLEKSTITMMMMAREEWITSPKGSRQEQEQVLSAA